MSKKSISARAEDRLPRLLPTPEQELEGPSLKTLLKLIYNTLAWLFHDPAGMVLGSTFLLLMLWGPHGNLELLGLVWKGWGGPGSSTVGRVPIIPGVPWDREWISFGGGMILLVLIPILLIKLVYKQDLRDYGLGLPSKDRWGLALLSAAVLLVLSLPAFYVGAHDPGMRATYPLYRGAFGGMVPFLIYEAGYLCFFVVIEFIFRGYLLFGLFNLRDQEAPPGVVGVPGPLVFGYYAIFISMLSYTAWHLGKPMPELWGTLVWGIAAGTVVLATRSILPIIAVHWLLNVFLDLLIVKGW